MTKNLLFSLLLLPIFAVGQQIPNRNWSNSWADSVLAKKPIAKTITDFSPRSGWVLDSTKWIEHDTIFSAKVRCDHSWVFQLDSASYSSGVGFQLKTSYLKPIHPFWQEDKIDRTYFYENRRKICRACLTEIAEHLVKYWRYVPPPKIEFELLKDKQKLLLKRR